MEGVCEGTSLVKILQSCHFNIFRIKDASERCPFKDTHREKAPSNKTPTLRKSTNMGVWAVGTLNQLFIRGS